MFSWAMRSCILLLIKEVVCDVDIVKVEVGER
jgi:hypothetical protein